MDVRCIQNEAEQKKHTEAVGWFITQNDVSFDFTQLLYVFPILSRINSLTEVLDMWDVLLVLLNSVYRVQNNDIMLCRLAVPDQTGTDQTDA